MTVLNSFNLRKLEDLIEKDNPLIIINNQLLNINAMTWALLSF
jgi:hypothetical protein